MSTENTRQNVIIILRSGRSVEFTCNNVTCVPGSTGLRSIRIDGAETYTQHVPIFVDTEQVDAVMVRNVVVDVDGGEQ